MQFLLWGLRVFVIESSVTPVQSGWSILLLNNVQVMSAICYLGCGMGAGGGEGGG